MVGIMVGAGHNLSPSTSRRQSVMAALYSVGEVGGRSYSCVIVYTQTCDFKGSGQVRIRNWGLMMMACISVACRSYKFSGHNASMMGLPLRVPAWVY